MTETQALILVVAITICATQTKSVHPGLPLTTALQSPLEGLRFSTEDLLDREPGMLRFGSQTRFQLLEAGCLLEAPSLAVLQDLPRMGNT